MMSTKVIAICLFMGLLGQGSADTANTTTSAATTTSAVSTTEVTTTTQDTTASNATTTEEPTTTTTAEVTTTSMEGTTTTTTMEGTTSTTVEGTTSTTMEGTTSTTMKETTTTTAMQQTTTTTTLATFSGSFTVAGADSLNSTIVETAAKSTVATHFEVTVDAVTVNATLSRRLAQAALRKLAGTWSVAFTLSVPEPKVASITTIAEAANTTSFASVLKTQLVAAGASENDVSQLAVQDFTATEVTTGSNKTTTRYMTPVTGGSSLPDRAFLCIILISTIVLTLLM